MTKNLSYGYTRKISLDEATLQQAVDPNLVTV
jgi:hypothetical protein